MIRRGKSFIFRLESCAVAMFLSSASPCCCLHEREAHFCGLGKSSSKHASAQTRIDLRQGHATSCSVWCVEVSVFLKPLLLPSQNAPYFQQNIRSLLAAKHIVQRGGEHCQANSRKPPEQSCIWAASIILKEISC
jgi:hypothetical protein